MVVNPEDGEVYSAASWMHCKNTCWEISLFPHINALSTSFPMELNLSSSDKLHISIYSVMSFMDQHPGQLPRLTWPVTGSVVLLVQYTMLASLTKTL